MAQIQAEIRDSWQEFETGDSGFNIVEALDILLPDDVIVKDPVCEHDYYADVGAAVPEGWADAGDSAMTGFTMVIPWREHKTGIGYLQDIRNLLDENARYSVEDSGNDTNSEIGSSLSFTAEVRERQGEFTFKIRFYVDDSTR